jgi:DNA-directed RNA polymerase specialized sigma24 family protein
MMREQHGHALQPSALVNEAFLRLMTAAPVDWKNRAHFFAHSARIMRNVLVDFARNDRFRWQIPQADLSSFSKLGGKEPALRSFNLSGFSRYPMFDTSQYM